MSGPGLDLAAVEALGEHLGRELARGSVVWLDGPLGAGKTTLVRAIARGRGVNGGATSPTFGLVHHYEGARGAIYHVDCYRIRYPDDAADLDWETLASSDLLLIEWPARAGAWAPPASARVQIRVAGDELRVVTIE